MELPLLQNIFHFTEDTLRTLGAYSRRVIVMPKTEQHSMNT